MVTNGTTSPNWKSVFLRCWVFPLFSSIALTWTCTACCVLLLRPAYICKQYIAISSVQRWVLGDWPLVRDFLPHEWGEQEVIKTLTSAFSCWNQTSICPVYSLRKSLVRRVSSNFDCITNMLCYLTLISLFSLSFPQLIHNNKEKLTFLWILHFEKYWHIHNFMYFYKNYFK